MVMGGALGAARTGETDMKAFTFELHGNNKKHGDLNGPVHIIVIKNAADKAAARRVAEANASGLRIVNSGVAHADDKAAISHAVAKIGSCNRYNERKNIPHRVTWFAADAAASESSIRRQREISRFLGLDSPRERNRCSSAFIYGGDTDADYA